MENFKKLAGAAIALGALGFTTQASADPSDYAGYLIVNEWNAVGDNKYLEDCPGGSCDGDTFFGSIPSNGGDWLELYVVQDIPVSIVGWQVNWTTEVGAALDQGSLTFVDTNSTGVWDNLLAGTIITIRKVSGTTEDEDCTPLTDCYDPTSCENDDWWIRVDSDGAYVEETGHTFESDNDCAKYSLTDGTDLIQNWVGEDEAGATGDDVTCPSGPTWIGSNLNAREVGKLEANPSASPTAYNDGNCSSFGSPNCWNSGSQDAAIEATRDLTCSP